MPDESYPLFQLIKKDPRYPLEAYMFVREALRFASDVLEMGTQTSGELNLDMDTPSASKRVERHMSGQELCEAIRQFSLNQFGYMSKVVLNEWGIFSTSDFGNIVYNMINAGLMRKSDNDRRSDFENVYDFDTEFDTNFEIAHVPSPRRM